MAFKEIFTAILIHLVIPAGGLIAFLIMVRNIHKEKVKNPPIIELFLIFSTYGGLLLVVLTSLFWKWSGMASLGTFYLILGAPIVMGFIVARIYKKRQLSEYHRLTYLLGVLYYVVTPISFGFIFALE